MTDYWEQLKTFYREKFGAADELVELVANSTILILCASGASNKTIGKFFGLEEKDVIDVIQKNFGFPGWFSDLSVNPYKLYLSVDGDQERFYELLPSSNLKKYLYEICKSMSAVERRIDNDWV